MLLDPALGKSQTTGLYPQFTKWYQDPLGFRPLQLSTAFGFVWGSAAVVSSLIFSKKDPSFQKKVSGYYEAGAGSGYKPPHTRMYQQELGLIYDIKKWMGIGLGWTASHFKDQQNNTWCFGIRPFARWYAFSSKKLKLFFEYGGGLSYSLNRFPLSGTGLEADTSRTGTKFNLTSKYGTGVLWQINGRLSLQSGIRHFHLSNGNMEGLKRNPSYDNNNFFLGISYNRGYNKIKR